MKSVAGLDRLMKVCVSVLLALNLVSTLSQPVTAASEKLYEWPTETLYQQALSWEVNEDDMIHAAIFMFAYTQRNPPEYVNNFQGRKDFVDKKLDQYFFVTNKAILLLEQNNLDPNGCPNLGNQGGGCVSWGLNIPDLFPPDAVLVCTKPAYQGTCKILFIGNYSSHQSLGVPNNSVASVKVGSRVKITLYASNLGDSPMTTLTQSDPDLGNNLTGNGDRWSNIVSTAKIEWR